MGVCSAIVALFEVAYTCHGRVEREGRVVQSSLSFVWEFGAVDRGGGARFTINQGIVEKAIAVGHTNDKRVALNQAASDVAVSVAKLWSSDEKKYRSAQVPVGHR